MKRLLKAGLLAAASVSASCNQFVKPLPSLPEVATPVGLGDRAPLMVDLETLDIDVTRGTVLGQTAASWNGCANARPLVYQAQYAHLDKQGYDGTFREVMREARIPVEALPRFAGEEVAKADLRLAATIHDLLVNICFPEIGIDAHHAIGNAFVSIEWSVFSPLERKVIYSVTTKGRSADQAESRVGEAGIIGEAFGNSLKRLLNDPGFVAVLTAGQPAQVAEAAELASKHPKASELPVGVSSLMGPINGAVVTVFSNMGQGTGFAVDGGDLVVTAAHVVSGGTHVKIATAQGFEYYGEVVAKQVPRDIALVRITGFRLKPLPISEALPADGSEVYLVGTPLSEKLPLSVTKGVVSAVRREQGLDYIQSDVSVLPGNSGGPLMDIHGNVLGMLTMCSCSSGVPAGVNFFVPGRDLAQLLRAQ